MKKLPHMILLLVFLLVSAGIEPAAGQEEPGQPIGPSSDPNSKHVYLPITMNGVLGFGVSGQVTDDLGRCARATNRLRWLVAGLTIRPAQPLVKDLQ